MKTKRYGCMLAGTLLAMQLFTGLAPAALAVDTAKTYRVDLFVEGVKTSCWDANGVEIPVLTYKESTYVPLRSVGQWMGKEVGWDASNRTITLQGSVAPNVERANTFYADSVLDVTPSPDVKVVVDGTARSFTGADGNPVYPLLVNGSAYLPLRAIGELLGMEVFWIQVDSNSDEIFLRTPLSDAQKQQMQVYIDALDEICVQLKDLDRQLNSVRGQPVVTSEAALAAADSMYALLDQLEALEIPEAKIWETYIPRLEYGITSERAMLDEFTAAVKGGKTPDECLYITNDLNKNGWDDLLHALAWFNISLNQYTKNIKAGQYN